MRQIRGALARIAGVFTGHRSDDDLHEELQAHLEMEIAENIRRGMHPDAARRKALLASGGLTVAAESVRAKLPPMEEQARQDLKQGRDSMARLNQAQRLFHRRPGFGKPQ